MFRSAGGRSHGAPGPWAGRESEGCGLAESESGRGRGRADWAQHREGEEGSRVVTGSPEDVCAHPKLKSFRPKAGAVEAGRRADMRIRAPANTTFLCVVFCSS